ncbi:MAG: hypothetical protein ACR2PM_00995 [Hyphomicrobiales bacterium]
MRPRDATGTDCIPVGLPIIKCPNINRFSEKLTQILVKYVKAGEIRRMQCLEVALSNQHISRTDKLSNGFESSHTLKSDCKPMHSSTRVEPSTLASTESKPYAGSSLMFRTVLFVSIHLVFVGTGLLLYST